MPDDSLFICLRVRNAGEAIDFYNCAFGAQELFRVGEPKGRIAHAQLAIGNQCVSLTDEFPEWGAFAPAPGVRLPVAIHLRVDDADRAVAQATGAGATVLRPAEDQPYGERRAILADPFGYEWVVRQRLDRLTPTEMEARLASTAREQT